MCALIYSGAAFVLVAPILGAFFGLKLKVARDHIQRLDISKR